MTMRPTSRPAFPRVQSLARSGLSSRADGLAGAPRQGRNRPRRTVRSLLAGTASLAAAAGVVSLGVALRSGDVMPLQRIAVHGVDSARADEIRVYTEVALGTPIFGIDLDEVAARVKTHPYVQQTTVRRVPPDGLEIEVTERQPVALLVLDRLYLLDAEGMPLKRARPGDGLDMPLITGLQADAFEGGRPDILREALAALRSYASSSRALGEVAEAHIEQGRGITLVFDGGVRVVLGRGAFGVKLARLEAALGAMKVRGLRARVLYLNDEQRTERVPVRLSAQAEMPGRAGT